MALHVQDYSEVPEDTATVARAAFPKGNPYLTLRDGLGDIYKDEQFQALFSSHRGRPAESPGRLALVTVLQFAEDLDDRSAAEAVRGRMDWKYLLGLPLTDAGFDYSVLSEFRQRVVQGGLEAQLLNTLLSRVKGLGLLKARGQQRTDSTHVLAAVRELNRLEFVGETLRQALNSLAAAVPDWMREQAPREWFERYGQRFEQYRLPSSKTEREALAETIGRDGVQLLQACYAEMELDWLWALPAVQTLRQVWVQQYYIEGAQMRWRTLEEVPPSAQLIKSPFDVQARYGRKRSRRWVGYTVHVTETCEEDQPSLITHVETTASTTPDVAVVQTIHDHLDERDLLPGEHVVDAGYVDAQNLVDSQQKQGIDLLGPAPPDTSWQARAGQGFDISCFVIDWETQQVTCPQGHNSVVWSPSHDHNGNPNIHVQFARQDCLACSQRVRCTRSSKGGRALQLRRREQHIALQQRRQRQHTEAFKEKYKRRAGVEATISQGTRAFGLRRSRYVGLAKTHLQHTCVAIAINLMRLAQWLSNGERTPSYCSPFASLALT
jgi:transposase